MKDSNKNKCELEVYSEEVQEIIGKIPSWTSHYGISTVFFFVIILLFGSWEFKYPDTINAKITVTTIDPPVSIIAQSSGKIDCIYVNNNEPVEIDAPLAVIRNPANSSDMFYLIELIGQCKSDDDFIRNASIFKEKTFSLGVNQIAYANFVTSLNNYLIHRELDYYPKKIALKNQEMALQKIQHHHITNQKSLVEEQYLIAKSIFERDSILLIKNIISGNEYDLSKKNFLQQKQVYASYFLSMQQSHLQLLKDEDTFLDLKQLTVEKDQRYRLEFRNMVETLKAQIKEWEHTYVLKSPINGVVTQMGVWTANQNVNLGETVFSVIPHTKSMSKGKALLPIHRAGKVKKGQQVNVRIENFPDQEFGYLYGRVESVSTLPNADGFYVVEISFPKGMETNYGKILPITQEMQGIADIITDDLRLLERFLMPLNKILQGQKSI
ncbi:HlyD family secretion protein [Porphyromonas levii]|uniref:HlyD family secretion protein n=1 Tax=Porphyromonas levii TaxID=28114 RepID=UPI000366496C|nr:HlyD family efflux transporter periplasmic adaptor subunit [Porphyromonas levii]